MKKIIWGILLTVVFSLSMLSTVLAADYVDLDSIHRTPPINKVIH